MFGIGGRTARQHRNVLLPHAAAEGFIRIASLEVELAAARKRAKTEA